MSVFCQILYSTRSSINKIISRDEFDNPGIYCLKGDPSDEAFYEKIYIGEAENIRSRLKQHLSDSKKEFKEIIFFISKDELLTKTQIKYLESRLIQLAIEAKAAGIRARKPKKFIATTDSKHNYPIAPNLLNRAFTVERPGEVWVSDITYVYTQSGWLYLTVIIDLYNRKVIGWAMSKGLKAEQTIIPAWRMALRNCPITQELIFHSDRGVQYACKAFTNMLKTNKLIKSSMSRKGNCWDNAVAESFFKTIKVEWIYSRTFMNQNQATLSIFEWIESWYNKRRRHSFLGFKTIDEFEKLNINFVNAA